MTTRTNLWKQSSLALLTSLLFAGSFVAGKYTTGEMGPLLITLLRYVIAAVFLQMLVWYQGDIGPRIGSASLADKVCLFLLGEVGCGLVWFVWVSGGWCFHVRVSDDK